MLLDHRIDSDVVNPAAAYQAVATAVCEELTLTAVERDRQAGLPIDEVQHLRHSGLLPLIVSREFGGIGATWELAFKVIQQLAQADGSTGQLYANQIMLSILPQVLGTPAQCDRYSRLTAQNHLFWGNALNARDARLIIEPEADHYRVNGVKSFGTGVAVADLRVFAAVQPGVDHPIIFILPADRAGVVYNNDWDNMGQRRTASGSFTFNQVWVAADEILGPPSHPDSAFVSLLFVVNQLAKTYVYLGIAEGAFTAAKQYTVTTTRPWLTSGVDQATQDPYILRHYGELWMQFQAAIALADQATQRVQSAWNQGQTLSHQERGEVAIAVYAAKAAATQAGLAITNRIFELTGSRATAAQYGFDRYWRDLRTFTLHDPVDYKLRDIGNWVLNQELPLVTQYS